MIDYKFENFVLEVQNFFSKKECQETIDYFEVFSKNKLTYSRQHSGISKVDVDDEQLFSDDAIFHQETLISRPNHPGPYMLFAEKFWKTAYSTYISKYGMLEKFGQHTIRHIKIQKTNVGEGYHAWHCEDANIELSHRILTFVLYLNDINDGGETEFLYYPRRVSPEAGKLILWPAGFTHTHRGNPPLKESKYIVTGWVEFV